MFNKEIKKVIEIEGMKCEHCAKRVKQGLESIKGVKEVNVILDSGKCELVLKKDVDSNLINQTIENLGYHLKA